MVIGLAIKYTFYIAPFLVSDIHKFDKLFIHLTKSICNIPQDSPNIFTQLPKAYLELRPIPSLERYATTLSEQPTQAFYNLGHLVIFIKDL